MAEKFNQLQLPAELIGTLYNGNIVCLETGHVEVKPEPKKKSSGPGKDSPAFSFMGENHRQIVWMIQQPGTVTPDESAVAFIQKMLEACKMELGDIALINIAHQPLTMDLVKKELHPAQVILFGVNPEQIGLPILFPEFKLQAYDNTTYLLVPDLTLLNQSNETGKLLKSKLWVCLRQLFQL